MIATERLQLIPATPEMVRAALAGPSLLGETLGAKVPASWPPEHVDPPALTFTLDRLAEDERHVGWWMYFVVLATDPGQRTVVGTAGYKGPPDDDGVVEVGYSILPDHRRRGYASEAVRALVANALNDPDALRVIAETLPELTPSIGVLRKCGFTLLGEGSEPGAIRFEYTGKLRNGPDC